LATVTELVALIPAARVKGAIATEPDSIIFVASQRERARWLPTVTTVARVPSLNSWTISLLGALNGLRLSEALGADIEALGLERGYRTPTVLRKGGKVVTVPLEPRTARAGNPAIGEPLVGPSFVTANGQRLDRHVTVGIVRRVARRASIDTISA
jgi:integrase